MKPMLQEKFQITVPPKQSGKDSPDSWATVESTMVKHPQDYLCLPTLSIEAPVLANHGGMPLSIAGTTDVSGKQADLKAQHEGYSLGDMGMTDDLYTGEHVDLFYGDAGGFVERNNYLDRA